jgi:hypothetical protein
VQPCGDGYSYGARDMLDRWRNAGEWWDEDGEPIKPRKG